MKPRKLGHDELKLLTDDQLYSLVLETTRMISFCQDSLPRFGEMPPGTFIDIIKWAKPNGDSFYIDFSYNNPKYIRVDFYSDTVPVEGTDQIYLCLKRADCVEVGKSTRGDYGEFRLEVENPRLAENWPKSAMRLAARLSLLFEEHGIVESRGIV